MIAIRRAAFITAAVELLFLVGCARSPAPEDVAVEYGRAMYRYDAAAIYRLASATDRRAKDEETVRAQVGVPSGFALDIIRHLALFIEAKPVDTRLWESRATVSLKLMLPDANAPEIRTLAHDWDETALDALSDSQRADIRRKLDELHERRTLPVVEGQETFELVKEGGGWRLPRRSTSRQRRPRSAPSLANRSASRCAPRTCRVTRSPPGSVTGSRRRRMRASWRCCSARCSSRPRLSRARRKSSSPSICS